MGDNKVMPLFTVIFTDGTHLIGGLDYFNTKWLDIPKDKKIKRIFYRLPNNDCLCLDGYDKYFHMIEATCDLNGRDKGKTKIEYAYIMAKKENSVISYRITLINKNNEKYHQGDITFRIFDINDERMKKLNQNNWR